MTYAIVNPLLLPELLSSVASYLHPEERYTCSFVCKAWNTFFNYFVWETCIVDHSQIARSTFLVDDLRKHAHQIHNLTYRGLISPEHLSIQYPNLILLRIQFKLLTRSDAIKDGGGRTAAMNMWLGVAALIKNCSELTTVDLSANRNIPTTQIWEAIKDNPTVTNLRLHNVELNWKQEHAFWSACTTLEKLDMEDCDIQQDDELHQRIIPDSFPKLQDIKLRHVKIEPGDLIAMMANSPQLRSLDWRGGRKSNWFDVFNLKKRMMMNPFEFSNFESLNLTGGGFGDEELAELIQSIKSPIKNIAFPRTQVGNLCLGALDRHFKNIQELDFSQCWRIRSIETATLLQSCSSLVSFKAHSLHSRYIQEDEPWACAESLRTLSVYFELDRQIPVETESKRVLACLATLTSLRELDIVTLPSLLERDIAGSIGSNNSLIPLQLRLSHGLEQLSTLCQLRRLSIGVYGQAMTMGEGVWIREHWKKLEVVQGRFNVDSVLNGRIHRLLRKYIGQYYSRKL